MAPGNTARAERQRARLITLIERIDERAVGAVSTILEIVADIGPRRGMRLVEAMATVIAVAPTRRRTRRAR